LTELSVTTSNYDDEEDPHSVMFERLKAENSVVFEALKEHALWGPFFRRQQLHDLEIGGKTAD